MKSMKNYALQILAVAALASTSLCATAATITFDDLATDTDGFPILNSYAGFNWNNFSVINGTYNVGGWAHSVVSPKNVIYNGYANPASFSSSTAFTLNSLYVTKAWYSGATHIEGYNGTSLLYSTDVLSTTASPTFAALNWTNLTSVVISVRDGSWHSAIDNITINAVPEPETYTMLLAGLGILGFAARRKRTAA